MDIIIDNINSLLGVFGKKLSVRSLALTNFIKIPPVEAELCHSDRRTFGIDKANSHFSQVCENA
jgi:hypothetical protein